MTEDDERIWLLFVAIVIVLIIIGVAIFVGVDFKAIEREFFGGQSCKSNADCSIGQFCSADGSCIATQTCGSDKDCLYGETCSQFSSNTKRCVAESCTQSSDCPQGPTGMSTIECINKLCAARACTTFDNCSGNEACVDGFCTPVGETCSTDSDCFRSGLSCLDSKCKQCKKTSDCPAGEYCDEMTGGICKTGCANDAACGSGNVCIAGNCCPTGGSCGMTCTLTSECTGDCNHCVNGLCTCIPGPEPLGDLRFTCTTDADCESGSCLPDTDGMGGVTKTCGWKAVECLYNNGTAGKLSTCPSTTAPFCVIGVCQASAAGTICGISELESCPKGLDCVNQICGVDRGIYGEECVNTSDCEPGLNCDNGICVPAS